MHLTNHKPLSRTLHTTNIKRADGTLTVVPATRYALPRHVVHSFSLTANTVTSQNAQFLLNVAKGRAASGVCCDAGDYARGCEVYYFDGESCTWFRGTIIGQD